MNGMHITEREIYFKGVAYSIVGTGKSEICKVGEHTGDPEKR